MRSGPAGPTQLHFWTMTGRPNLQVTLFAYRPKDARLWWAEWYQEQERRAPGAHPGLFPVLSPLETSWAPGGLKRVDIVPAPGDRARTMESIVIDDAAGRIVERRRFAYELPVTHLKLDVADWPTGLYRAIVVPASAAVDPAVRDFKEKILSLIVRPRQPPEPSAVRPTHRHVACLCQQRRSRHDVLARGLALQQRGLFANGAEYPVPPLESLLLRPVRTALGYPTLPIPANSPARTASGSTMPPRMTSRSAAYG